MSYRGALLDLLPRHGHREDTFRPLRLSHCRGWHQYFTSRQPGAGIDFQISHDPAFIVAPEVVHIAEFFVPGEYLIIDQLFYASHHTYDSPVRSGTSRYIVTHN